MKRLFLVRHAKSSWDDPSLDDMDRPLNNRGKKNAPEMGLRLRKQGIIPDLLISSPANRAFATAKKISDEIGYPKKKIVVDDRLYHGSSNSMISIIQSQKNKISSIMLFGHNPGFTDFANMLCGINIYNIPTAGIVAIDFSIDNWSEADYKIGELVFFDYPKKLPSS
jgi:phosphohistidine phosphatase